MMLHTLEHWVIYGQLLNEHPLIGTTSAGSNQSDCGILWVMCAKGWVFCEIRVQKGGSLVASHVQGGILKDVMPTAFLLSCQSN